MKYSNSGLDGVDKGEELNQILAGYAKAADGGFCPDVFVPTNASTEISSQFRDDLLPNYLLGDISLEDVCSRLQEMYDSYLEDL